MHNYINKEGSKRGVGLLLMLFAMSTAVMLLVGGGLFFAPVQNKIISSGVDGQKAFYAAEAGVQQALYRVSIHDVPTGAENPETFDFVTFDGTISVTIDYAQVVANEEYDITSAATVDRRDVTISATIKNPAGETAYIDAWSY